MDFGIGYRWRSFESNLLLAVRLPSDGTGSVETTSATPADEPPPPKPARPRPRKPRPPPAEPRGFFLWR
jgi:hypothetical protein